MSARTHLQGMSFFRVPSALYVLKTVLILAFSIIIQSCSTHNFEQTSRSAETKFILDSANFDTEVVFATGEASCVYILWSIPMCEHQNIMTTAWGNMRQEAQMEGKSAQFVNIVEDHSLRWNFLYLIYQEYYSVSGNVIVYKRPDQ